jgi:hypothetical protein
VSSLLGPAARLQGLKSCSKGHPSLSRGPMAPTRPAAVVHALSNRRLSARRQRFHPVPRLDPRSPTPGVHEVGGLPSSRTVTASVPFAVIVTRQRLPSECVNALLMASLAMRYAASSTAGDKTGSDEWDLSPRS